MSARTLGNTARGQDTGRSDMQEALAPSVKAFTITKVNDVFYVPMNGRAKMRVQLGSADGKALTVSAVTIDVDLTLAPVRPGRGSYGGEAIPPFLLATDWIDSGADITETAIGTFVDITGPCNLVRFTVTALTIGTPPSNLQLWVM